MSERQIVIISGKTCSGKTGLAELLEKEFGFFVVRTRDILSSHLELNASSASRLDLIEQGQKLNANTDSKWVVVGVLTGLDSIDANRPVVVDHVSDPNQVKEFRKQFGPSLVHVHLYASEETLLSRYADTDGRRKDAPAYESIDHLKEQWDVDALMKDADVRISTTRTDAQDTLVRVAARLHLYTPPDVRCVDVVVGGQYGSEGKGNVVSYLAREYDVMVRVGGPNAGHTVANAQGAYTYHHIPSGARDVKAKLLLGPGMTIWLPGLFKEIADCALTPDRLFIDPQATIIEESDRNAERQRLVGTIASTGSGSGSVTARRILERGNPSVRLARDVPELEPYVGTKGHYRGCTADRLEEAYRNGESILLEGTQGSGLSLFHGIYPFVTSRDTNVAGCLAEAVNADRILTRLSVFRRSKSDPPGSCVTRLLSRLPASTFALPCAC
ncbi:adenylosuccinate synthetase, partial [Ralstonia solanacearum]